MKEERVHREPTPTTKRQILGTCGNQCAFTGCSNLIVDREHDVIVGKIAHIKGRKKGAARFDPLQLEENNRSASNLIALCGKHHDIVDTRKDIYTVEKLTSMKIEHEEKVENSADRLWIKFPNAIVENIKELGQVQIYYWIDRTGRPQIYNHRKLAIAKTVFNIWQDIEKFCQLYELVEDNPDALGKHLMQNYVKLNKTSANLENGVPWKPMVHILSQMAEIPDTTFGELLSYLVVGGDATKMFAQRSKVLEEKIKKLKEV